MCKYDIHKQIAYRLLNYMSSYKANYAFIKAYTITKY